MTPELQKIRDHAEAVDTLFADNVHRHNALIGAQDTILQYDRSPMRDMALQSLQRAITRSQEMQAALSPYTRTLRAYIAEIERNG